MTATDARMYRFDQRRMVLAFQQPGSGRGATDWPPRTVDGGRLSGSQSLTVVIEEEADPMQVSMRSAPMSADPALLPQPVDRDTAVELERLRLQAGMDREREVRRERRREEREEHRRERDADRDRRREEERKERQAEDARRADREAQTHALMVQVLKEMAAGRQDRGRDDTLMAAVLAKIGQPDPLVLKLLDNHGTDGR
jgi:hypothetical protein